MSRVWLIPGSSHGFGRALAEAVLAGRHKLVATARNHTQLTDLVGRCRQRHQGCHPAHARAHAPDDTEASRLTTTTHTRDTISADARERLLQVLSAATFLIFFQAYMVAPLIPRLSTMFLVSGQMIGLIVPAYMIPYGVSTLFYGLLSDRLGRRRIMLASLLTFVILTALTATAHSAAQLILWRLLTGLGASGVVPLALALMGQLFPYEERGRPLGWLFGAMAGGMAFGSTFGALLEPFIGWRGIFLGVSGLSAGVLGLLYLYQRLLGEAPAVPLGTIHDLFAAYKSLLGPGRGRRTYAYVLLNAIFHSGVFTWLGLHFTQRYGLGEVGIGLALLGYGVPGFLLGPPIGRAADRWGRRWLIPAGLGIAAIAAAALMWDIPLLAAALAVTLLSLGYDMTQPLLGGIVTTLGGPQRGGQAMGLNVFMLFTGFGLGSLLFGAVLSLGFGTALAIFSVVQLGAAVVALRVFRAETPQRAQTRPVG
jgi:predicted MFS family arabinose efflux permease